MLSSLSLYGILPSFYANASPSSLSFGFRSFSSSLCLPFASRALKHTRDPTRSIYKYVCLCAGLLVVDVASSRSLAVIAEGCVRREDGSNPGPPAAPTLDAASLVRAIDAARLRLIRFTEDQLDSVSVLGMFFLVALCRLVYDKRRDGVNLREIYQEYNTEFLALSVRRARSLSVRSTAHFLRCTI